MMRKYLLAGGVAAVVLLGACGAEEATEDTTTEEAVEETFENDVDEESETIEEDTEEASEEESAEEDSAGTDEATRSNPAALGETVSVEVVTYDENGERLAGTGNVTVDNVVRRTEAVDILTTEYMEPDPIDDGQEWAVFDLTFELTEFEDDDHAVLVSENIEIFKEDGSNVSQDTYMWVEDEAFPAGEIYSGGTASGKVARAVPEGKPFLIKYNDHMEAEAFFRVE